MNQTYKEARAEFTRTWLVAIMARHDGNVATAAKEAGLARTSLYRLLEVHGFVRKITFEVGLEAK